MVGDRNATLQFIVTTSTTASVVVALSWWSGLKTVAYGALLSLAAFAFLPFVLIFAAFLAFALLFAIATVLTGGLALGGTDVFIDASHDVSHALSARVERPYYRVLLRQRHPVFWGLPTGVMLGGLLVWGLLWRQVYVPEARTAAILAAASARIEELQREMGRYPAPDARGYLQMDGAAVVDGFGQPLRYVLSGPRLLQSYLLRADGYDGRPGGDDLCIAAQSRLRQLADRAGSLAELLGKVVRQPTLADKTRAIRALRCSDRP